MSWRLDPPVRVGGRVFAALTQVEVTGHTAGRNVVATASKRPCTILMLEDGKITALDLDGCVHTPSDTVEAYPEAVARLRVLGKAPDGNGPIQPDSSEPDAP